MKFTESSKLSVSRLMVQILQLKRGFYETFMSTSYYIRAAILISDCLCTIIINQIMVSGKLSVVAKINMSTDEVTLFHLI